MTAMSPKDIGPSVRARLLRLARDRGEDFQLVLTRYANERLLFRVASSPHGSRFVLKGVNAHDRPSAAGLTLAGKSTRRSTASAFARAATLALGQVTYSAAPNSSH